MRRWLIRIGIGLLVLVLLLAGLAAWLVGTTSGGRAALSIADGFLPDSVSVSYASFEGRLINRFELRGVRFAIPTLAVEAGHVAHVPVDHPHVVGDQHDRVLPGQVPLLLEVQLDHVVGRLAGRGHECCRQISGRAGLGHAIGNCRNRTGGWDAGSDEVELLEGIEEDDSELAQMVRIPVQFLRTARLALTNRSRFPCAPARP